MKHSRMLLIVMLILPWLTLPLLGRNAVKKFLPASLFISLLVRSESIIAKKRKWWWFYETIHSKLSGIFPFIWGPYFVGAMWILKLTYGKPFIYMITNLIIDTLFVYPFVTFLKKSGIGSLVRLKKYQLLLSFFFKSWLLYGFQYLKEKIQTDDIKQTI